MQDYFIELGREALKYVHWVYLLVFMVTTYTLKEPVHAILNGFFPKIESKVWAVFIIGFIMAIPFWMQGDPKMQLFITYTLGTSLHDLIISYIIEGIKKLIPKKTD